MKTKVRDGLIAGEAIGKGKLCYLKSDGKYWLADASAAEAVVRGSSSNGIVNIGTFAGDLGAVSFIIHDATLC